MQTRRLVFAIVIVVLMSNAAFGKKKAPEESRPTTTAITLVTLQDGHAINLAPNWAIKWCKKNAKKYPGVHFQTDDKPVSGVPNYMIAFSSTAAEAHGFQPVVHHETATNPVSGSGTITNSYGDQWNYTYNGSVTTTTTTHTNDAYVINTVTLFATAYNDRGQMISQQAHVYSTQTGGDSSSAFGYNMGNALRAIKAHDRLLRRVVEDCIGKQ